MKKLAKMCLAAILATVFVGCLSVSWAASGSQGSAQSPQMGQIKKILGKATIMRPGARSAQTARTGDLVRARDRLETLSASKAWWSLRPSYSDQNDASLGPNSQLEFSGYAQKQGSSEVLLEVSTGIVRLIKVLPRTSPESTFMVTTPTALAWVDIPEETADFVVESLSPEMTVITVIRGTVRVKNISESINTVRTVQACQTVTIEQDKEPSEVRRVSSGILRSLIERTTIPGTLPEDVPSCDRSAQANQPEEQASAALIPPVVLVTPEIVIIPGDDPPETICPICHELRDGVCAPLPCPEGAVFDAAAPGCCACPPCHELRDGRCEPITCPDRAEFDPTAPGCCRCAHCHEVRDGECLQIQCPANNEFNVTAPGCCRPCGRCEELKENGHCGPIQCPEGGMYDPAAESCCTFMISGPPKSGAPPAPQTGTPFRVVPYHTPDRRFPDGDPSECNLTCPKGQRLDPVACRCIPAGGCNLTCPKGQRLDPSACKCVPNGICNRTCPRGKRLDSAACKCVPQMSHKDTARKTRSEKQVTSVKPQTEHRRTLRRTEPVKPRTVQPTVKPRTTPSLKPNHGPMMRMKQGKRMSSCPECVHVQPRDPTTDLM